MKVEPGKIYVNSADERRIVLSVDRENNRAEIMYPIATRRETVELSDLENWATAEWQRVDTMNKPQ